MPFLSRRRSGRLLPTLAASSVAVVVIAVSIVGFFLTSRSTSDQERALLRSETNQAAIYASQLFNDLSNQLNQSAAAVRLTGGSPKTFSKMTGAAPPVLVVLVHKVGSSYEVEAGDGFRSGYRLSGPARQTVAEAGSSVVAGPVSSSGKVSVLRFAIGGSSLPPGLAIYEQISVNPFTVSALITEHAFSALKAVLYGSDRIAPGHLVASTTPATQLSGTLARATVAVGSTHWLLVAAARHQLIGGFAAFSPTMILLLGIVLALIAGSAIEIAQRRRLYADRLVTERTAALNHSLEELRAAQGALVRSERLAALGEMATVVAHELRNPLAAVMNGLYLIRSQVPEPRPERLEHNLEMAEREAEKAARLADQLTDFVRPRKAERSPVAARSLLEEVLGSTPPPPGVEVTTDVEPVTFSADGGQMAEILTNLLTNAYQEVSEGGHVVIRLASEGDSVRIAVEDSGAGIDPSVAARLFEPFFTTRAKGTGLGLAIVQRLVLAHGGEVSCEPAPSGGARFVVLLPACLQGSAASIETAASS